MKVEFLWRQYRDRKLISIIKRVWVKANLCHTEDVKSSLKIKFRISLSISRQVSISIAKTRFSLCAQVIDLRFPFPLPLLFFVGLLFLALLGVLCVYCLAQKRHDKFIWNEFGQPQVARRV